ncbi:type II secretion system F family protein [Massilia sp. MB5]|uniref:type II secretion system F family protein n=1 Tax=Massilia sp. MB5 TaxID=2919578 RepID=UPI001F102073|nr:type II secretion system F family protein [Massilia sp. MB5]UMR32276.1 type II secretion system F family protein [Massilia sp. MB5]
MRAELMRHWARPQFTANQRVRLYRKIAKMLAGGLPLLRILEELARRNTGPDGNYALAMVLDDCRRTVQNGQLLSDGLAWWVPDTEQMIILAGEQSGRLEGGLTALIEVVQAGRKIRTEIISGLAYPLAVIAMIALYIWLFGAMVIPQFTKLADPTRWHGAALSLYKMSVWVQEWMLLTVAGAVALIAALLFSLPVWRGNVRVLLDRFAPFSIYRLIAGSGFLLAFAALQAAGVTVEKSLARLSLKAQPWLRERLDGALMGVRSGLNCGEALRHAGYGFPSPAIIDDLCVYAEYKGFSEALKLLAAEWMEEGVEAVALRMKVLNGFAIVTLALVIGWLVTGFFGIQQEIANATRAVG